MMGHLNGVAKQIQDVKLEQFGLYFGLKLSYFLIFGATEKVSRTLQRLLSRQRIYSAFNIFYSATVADAQQYTDVPVLPYYRQPPKQVDRGSAPHMFTTAEEYYCTQYFEVLDLLAAEIARRFNQSSLALPLAVEELLIGYVNDKGDEQWFLKL